MVSFTTKDGRKVSFTPKTGGKKRKSRKRAVKAARITAAPRSRRIKRKGENMAKKRSSSRGGGSMSGGLTGVLLGGAVAGFVGSMIPAGNIGKIAVAAVAGNKGGIVGNSARALGVIGIADLVKGTNITGATTTAAGNGW
jgi:hypothetical protein